MSVHKRKDGRYAVSYYVDGVRKWKYFGRGDLAQARAEQWDRDWKKEHGKSEERSGYDVDTLIAMYRAERTLQPSTYKMDRYKFLVIRRLLGANHADTLTSEIMSKYVKIRLEAGVKRVTIASEIRRLKTVLNWACQHSPPLLITNPISAFRLESIEAPDVPPPPSIPEIRAILEHAEPHLARAIHIFWNTGIRPGGEMFRIRWHDVDLKNNLVRIISARKLGPAHRFVPIDRLRARLDEWMAEDKEIFGDFWQNYPVVHFRKQPVMSLKKSWKSAKKAAKINRRIRLYDLRHAFATYALQEGADLKAVSEILGHSRPDTTLKSYQHVSRQQHRDAIMKVPEL